MVTPLLRCDGQRRAERIGTKKEHGTKTSAEKAAGAIRDRIFGVQKAEPVMLDRVADRYVAERMPTRHTTGRGYRGKLKIVRAKWGKSVLPLSPSAVELWLKDVKKTNGEMYSKKSREHLKSILGILQEAAMFFEMIPITANPMALVKVPTVMAAPKPKPRIVLSKMNSAYLLARFTGMYRVMIVLAACVGLRRSEIFGLRWSDFNWLLREVFIQRSHVEGYEDETKTASSNAKLPLHPSIIEALLAWRQRSSFNADND